jgi:hypothetical protein
MATESLSGIFVILVAMPWALIVSQFTNAIGVELIALNTVLMALCVVIVNGYQNPPNFGESRTSYPSTVAKFPRF